MADSKVTPAVEDAVVQGAVVQGAVVQGAVAQSGEAMWKSGVFDCFDPDTVGEDFSRTCCAGFW